MPTVSIIVPVHNTSEEHLLECLESIKGQTHKNIETIIVDDGSNKETADFLDRYVRDLDSWRVIHQKNAGVNMARKTGFEESKGEFVTFVDSDDALMNVFCERLYKAAIKTGADVTIAERYDFNGARPTELLAENKKLDTLTDKREIIKANYVAPFGMNIYSVTIWGQLYKRQLIEKIDWDFSNYTIAEDEFWVVQTKIFLNKVTYVHEQLYCYRISESSRSKMTKAIYFKGYGENRIIPFISLGLEIFRKSTQLYKSYKIKPPYELFAYTANCTKVFVSKLSAKGMLDSSNIDLAKHIAIEFLDSANLTNQKKEIIFDLELIKYNPEISAYYTLMCEGYRQDIEKLKKDIFLRDKELELLRKPEIKLALRKFLGSLKRALSDN